MFTCVSGGTKYRHSHSFIHKYVIMDMEYGSAQAAQKSERKPKDKTVDKDKEEAAGISGGTSQDTFPTAISIQKRVSGRGGRMIIEYN